MNKLYFLILFLGSSCLGLGHDNFNPIMQSDFDSIIKPHTSIVTNSLLTKDLYQLYLFKDFLELKHQKAKIISIRCAILSAMAAVGCISLNPIYRDSREHKDAAIILGIVAFGFGFVTFCACMDKINTKEALSLINKHILRLKNQVSIHL